jgi:hypothetical protein
MLKLDLKSRCGTWMERHIVQERNDLLTGHDLLPSFIGMLCQLGHCEAAFSADTAEMYHQVWISESEKGSRWCFVWMDGRSGYQRDLYGVRALDTRCCVDVCLRAVKATGADGVFGISVDGGRQVRVLLVNLVII